MPSPQRSEMEDRQASQGQMMLQGGLVQTGLIPADPSAVGPISRKRRPNLNSVRRNASHPLAAK